MEIEKKVEDRNVGQEFVNLGWWRVERRRIDRETEIDRDRSTETEK